MKKRYLIILGLCMSFILAFALPAHAQDSQTVSGTVVFEDGEPVIGATLKVEGTTTATITDLDGKYSIQVPTGKNLIVSYIGHASQTISNFANTRIVLKEDALQLNDVVVVGYGVQKKAHLTGSIATTNMTDVTDLVTGDLSSALRGLMNGVSVSSSGTSRPGATSRIDIRQNNVVSGSSTANETDPLYVIDGYAYPMQEGAAAFNNLDATMVESISVLKDASAAVYGSRAGNGVVLVTTKRGQIGKPKISYSGQFGYADEISRPKMLNSYDYGRLWNGVRAANPSEPYDSRLDLFQADELEVMKGLNYDLLEDAWSAAFTQKHAVNMGGGTDNANYFAGIAYYSQDGNIGKLNYERWNYRAGMDLKINKWLKASLQVSGNYGEDTKAYNGVASTTGSEADYNRLLTQPRYIPSSIDGRPIASYGITNATVHNSQLYNFDAIQNSGDYKTNINQEMNINTGLEYDFGWNQQLKGLKLKFSYIKSINTLESKQLGTSYILYNLVNRGGSGNHLYSGGGVDLSNSNFVGSTINNGGMVDRTMSRTDNYQMNFLATYQRTFGNHDISGLFGIEKSERVFEDLYGSRSDLFPNSNGQSSTTGNDATTKDNRFSRAESASLSYIGRINYAYKDRYLFEFLIRSDASTKFAPENYWGVFPSVSGGWILSQEEWFKVEAIDYLKLRGSFGLTGRDNIPTWTWAKNYNYNSDKGPVFGSSSSASGNYITLPDQGFNRNAKWDKSYKSNYGLDLGLLNNRLSVNIDGYYEWNRDIFTSLNNTIPSTAGSNPANENYSSIDTYGIEIAVGWKDKIGDDFKYGVRINTGYSDNKLNKTNWPSTKEMDGIVQGERRDRGVWGLEALGMFKSYQEIEEYFDKNNITNYLGLSKADMRPGMLIYKDVRSTDRDENGYYIEKADGVIDEKADRVKISNRSDNIYGFTVILNTEWKSFSLSMQLNANWGSYTVMSKNMRSIYNSVLNTSGYNSMQYTNLPSFWANNMFIYEDVLDANGNVVAEANRNARYPNLMYDKVNSVESTFWRVNNASVSMSNITLAYTLPKVFIQKVGVESCRLNMTAQNVLNFHNSYPDNFYSSFAGSYGQYPNLRKITLGVNVSF